MPDPATAMGPNTKADRARVAVSRVADRADSKAVPAGKVSILLGLKAVKVRASILPGLKVGQAPGSKAVIKIKVSIPRALKVALDRDKDSILLAPKADLEIILIPRVNKADRVPASILRELRVDRDHGSKAVIRIKASTRRARKVGLDRGKDSILPDRKAGQAKDKDLIPPDRKADPEIILIPLVSKADRARELLPAVAKRVNLFTN